jgi:hypothetical protein
VNEFADYGGGCRNPKAKKLIQGLPNLVKYADRVHDDYFPDYQKWT